MVSDQSHTLDWGKAVADQERIAWLYFQLALDQCPKASKCQHWFVVQNTAARTEAHWSKLLHCM